jgi:hypothetical protein
MIISSIGYNKIAGRHWCQQTTGSGKSVLAKYLIDTVMMMMLSFTLTPRKAICRLQQLYISLITYM